MVELQFYDYYFEDVASIKDVLYIGIVVSKGSKTIRTSCGVKSL